MVKKFKAQLFSRHVLQQVTQVLVWALSLNIICENLVNNSLIAADSRTKTKRAKRSSLAITDSGSDNTKANNLAGLAGGIITGNSCTVTVPGASADPRDYTNINNCASGFCSGGICVDQCTGTDKGALGQPCCDQIGIDAGLCTTLSLCCSSAYSCDLNNSAIYNENAVAQCCITGTVSPGNHKMACTADTDCCQNAICTLDAADPDQNSYCVTCSTEGETCKDGVLCCNNQRLNCVDGTCEACIGQNCATGTACCPESVIPGIFCGIDQAGTVDRCCVKANFGCNFDQDCCAGNNCVIDNTIPGNNGKGVCTPCSSKVGDICSLKQPCCSSNQALSCIITSTEPGATGTCQNICASSEGCNTDYYCNITDETTGVGTCVTCADAACTGYDGDICNDDCDADVYECRSAKCVLKTPADEDSSLSNWQIFAIAGGATAAVAIAGLFAWKWWKTGRESITVKPQSDYGTGDKARVDAGTARAAQPRRVRRRVAAAGAGSGGTAARVAAARAVVSSAGASQLWQDTMIKKVSGIKAGENITDPTTLGILRSLASANLLKSDVSGANLQDIKLQGVNGEFTIKFPANSAQNVMSAALRLPARPDLAPGSPVLEASTEAFIKSTVLSGFDKKSGGYANLYDLLNGPNNVNTMRKIWSAAYYELLAKDKVPTDADIMEYLLTETDFRELFTADSDWRNVVKVKNFLTSGDSNLIENKFKDFQLVIPPNIGQSAVTDRLIAPKLQTYAPSSFEIARKLAGIDQKATYTFADQEKIGWAFRKSIESWAPADITRADFFMPRGV